jgi:hypothetical protein
MSSYNVVFRYTESAGAYAGAITWTSFKSKADFDIWLNEKPLQDQEIIAENVSQDEAIQLVETTPSSTRINVAIAEATDSNGVINPERLRRKLMTVVDT